jgi:hypothetical protein
LYRRAYNLAVSNYLNGTYKNEANKWKNLRPEIKAQCKKEQEESNSIYNSAIIDNAVLSAQTTFKTVLKNSKNKNYSKIRFKSRKGENFTIDVSINGARGILLKQLTWGSLTPNHNNNLVIIAILIKR